MIGRKVADYSVSVLKADFHTTATIFEVELKSIPGN